MSQIDYEELLRSPLDEVDAHPTPPWVPLSSGLVLGLLAGTLVLLLLGGDTAPTVTTEATMETTTTTVAADVSEYPPGYVEFAPDLAARAEEILVEDDLISVAFTTVVARGADPATTSWPRGGSWLLETAAGVTVESNRVVFGAATPGAFSVQFPAASLGPAEFHNISLIERWDPVKLTATVSLPFSGEPFRIDEPVSIPLNSDVTLVVPTLELGRFQGSIDWTIVGSDVGASVTCTPQLRDGDGAAMGTYEATPEVEPPRQEGRLDLEWQRSFPYGQEGAVTVDLDCVVDNVAVTPVSTSFSLDDIPVST
jgi:hypothetical protein